MDDDGNVYADDVSDEIPDDDAEHSDDVADMMDEVDFEDYDADGEIEEDKVESNQHGLTKFSGHKGPVFAVDVNRQVGLVVSGGEDDMAYVWNIDNGEILLTCDGHKDSITSVCFNHDGKLVATGDMSGVIQVWNVENYQKIWSFETGDLEWLEWHPAAPILLAGTQDGQCWMWQIPKDNCKIYESHGVATNAGRFMPDGKAAFVSYADGTSKLMDLKSTEGRFNIRDNEAQSTICIGRDAHEESIADVACSADGSLIATASLDGTMKLISTSSGKVTNTYDCKNQNADNSDDVDGESVECVAFSPTLPLLATGCLNGFLHIWDHKSGNLRHSCKHERGITKLLWDYHKNGNVLYTASLDGTCRSWDARNGQLLHSFEGPPEHIYDLKLSSTGDKLVAAYADGIVRVFEINTSVTEPLRNNATS